jgi:6-phosphofructokinase 1
MSKQRIGILTSGGDCPGLNAVIRGAVKASHQLGYDCIGFLKGYEGLYDPVQYVHLTPSSTRGILSQGGTILGSTNKGRFAATVGVQDRQEIEPHLIEGVKQTIEQLGITGLVCVGGDGSLAVAQQFHEQGIPVVGVPKTIDNDLSATAFTFGFDSAVECATDALDRLHTTAASHERIMVLEVMGRHAGWIALHAGIAGGGDVILLPEIKWNWDHVCHKILQRESKGKKFTLVVVAEGAHLPDGELVGERNSGSQMKLGGIGRIVCDEIERRLQREVRLSVLGHLQRGGQPTTFDRVLATQYGAHAVRLVHQRKFGEMLCYQPPEMNSVPIMEAVNVLRRVDANGAAVQAARALGISFGDRPVDEVGSALFDRVEVVASSTIAAPQETTEEYTDDFTERLAAPAFSQPAVTPLIAETLGEEGAAEEIAETLLDLVADADELIHGPVEIEGIEVENPETDELEDGADQIGISAPAALEMDLDKTPDFALSLDDEESSEALEESASKAAARTPVDLTKAQALLAKRIAEAAQAKRGLAATEVSPEPDAAPSSAAERLKQKFAAASPSANSTPAGSSLDDPLAAARSALEEALLD